MEPSYAAKAEAVTKASQAEPIIRPSPVQRTAELISITQPINNGTAAATAPDTVPTTAMAALARLAADARQPAASEAAKPRRDNWFPALCAGVALLAAVVALVSPALRPSLDAQARKWLGPDNPVSRLVAPGGATASPLVTEEMLRASLAGYDARIQVVSDSVHRIEGEVAGAVAALHAATDGTASLSATMNELSRRADRLQSAGTQLEARGRTASVLALAVNLRRGIDAGVPVGQECAALRAIGSFPAPVDHALTQLTAIADRIPTMRDLADGFDRVEGRIAARAEGSSLSSALLRVRNAMGFGEPSVDEIVLERLRLLAADGRFSEAATLLETSEMADLGVDWVAMVRARATAVVATQLMLDYALQGTATAFAAAPATPVGSGPR